MRIFAVDDEPGVLETLHEAIEAAAPGAEILDFTRGQAALDAVVQEGVIPDVIFSDIRMPGMDGLQLAVSVRKAAPATRIIFVTAFSEYALEAWKSHVHGYVMKPVTAEDIRDAIQHLQPTPAPVRTDKLRIRCFGYFEVFWKNEPLIFARKKTKELLAILVVRKGSASSAEELISVLYENTGPEDMKKAKQNLRNLIFDLTETLEKIGQRDILLRKGSSIAIYPEKLDCDYYQMLARGAAAPDLYYGEFMEQYSWAESAKGMISSLEGRKAMTEGDYLEEQETPDHGADQSALSRGNRGCWLEDL